MSIVADDWKVVVLGLGVILLIPLAILWFLSLGHIKLVSIWWRFLKEHEDKILYG